MVFNKENRIYKNRPGSPCAGPMPQCPAQGPHISGRTGRAASLRPGMQPAWAAPCPNQFEPAAGMEPWLSPRAPPGAQARLRAALRPPAW